MVTNALLAEGVDLEEHGGAVQVVHTSAKTGVGLEDLTEALQLQVRPACPRARAPGSHLALALPRRPNRRRIQHTPTHTHARTREGGMARRGSHMPSGVQLQHGRAALTLRRRAARRDASPMAMLCAQREKWRCRCLASLPQAELMDLRASPTGAARAVVVEATQGRSGPQVTVVVRDGRLKVGDAVVVGTEFGKVRACTLWLARDPLARDFVPDDKPGRDLWLAAWSQR